MPETQHIEYKQSWHDDYLKWICGFANAAGGRLFVGVNDNGSVVGVDNYKLLMEEIPSKAKNLMGISVSVNLKDEDYRYYLEIVVPSYSVPISLRGRYYYRTGSTNSELTGNSLNEFLIRKFGRTWDDVVEEDFDPNDLDAVAIETFKKLAIDRIPGILAETDLLVLLDKLNLVHKKKL